MSKHSSSESQARSLTSFSSEDGRSVDASLSYGALSDRHGPRPTSREGLRHRGGRFKRSSI